MDERLKLYSAKQLSDLYQAGNRVFGVSKTYPHAAKQMPNEDKLRGYTGEQIVSGLLNLNVLDQEEMYVCHSVGTHDESQGQTDHIVIYKNKILIVETKTYNGYSEIRISKDNIARGLHKGVECRAADNKIGNKIKIYQKRFPNRRVEGLLTIARYGVITKSLSNSYDATSISEFQNKIDKFVSSAKNIKEDAWPTVKFFGAICIRDLN